MHIGYSGKVLEALREFRSRGMMTLNEAEIFLEVQRYPGRTVSEVATSVGLPMSTTSRVVFSLVERGVFQYGRQDDRRKRTVQLSEVAA